MQPYLVKHLSSWLDQGLSAWHHKNRHEGFFAAWRHSATRNVAWVFEELAEWRHQLDYLSDDPMDVIIEELRRLGLPQDRWVGYLERIALELPGWAGMFLWRHSNPGYEGMDLRLAADLPFLAH